MKIENYLGVANHDIQIANNSDELKSYVASILCEIDELQQENKYLDKVIGQLEDNWNKLKKYIRETKLKEFEKSYGKRYGKTFTQAEIIVCNMILDKMQEIERCVSDDNN